MCTRHLGDNFALLANALGEAPDAADYLRDAERALYDGDPLLASRTEVAAEVVKRIYQRNPGWAGRERCLDDVDYHLNYLADAVRNAQPAAFRSYIEFVAAFLERRGVSRAHLDETLGVLDVVLGERGHGDARAVLRG
jgi:hypothetical protein